MWGGFEGGSLEFFPGFEGLCLTQKTVLTILGHGLGFEFLSQVVELTLDVGRGVGEKVVTGFVHDGLPEVKVWNSGTTCPRVVGVGWV
jgi:hypothetical protein